MRRSFLALAFVALCATPCRAQSVYVVPAAGALDLDFDLPFDLGVEIHEGVLLGVGGGYRFGDRWSIEAHYATTGFEIRYLDFEPIEGRFQLFGAGPRVTLLTAGPASFSASLFPGVLIATNEVTDSTTNVALPIGLDAVVLPERRVRARAGVQDYLHRCDPPEEFAGLLCGEGEWLHHVALSVGVEVDL